MTRNEISEMLYIVRYRTIVSTDLLVKALPNANLYSRHGGVEKDSFDLLIMELEERKKQHGLKS